MHIFTRLLLHSWWPVVLKQNPRTSNWNCVQFILNLWYELETFCLLSLLTMTLDCMYNNFAFELKAIFRSFVYLSGVFCTVFEMFRLYHKPFFVYKSKSP